ncbi:uncharacterized protein YjbI with pentapeptide repeats [Bacillus oleivorans]|uniref:Uncharacterized protein YjbI with pentapeptide repeats n=1 Tax=Bacillus oleivorans TaxID=1448271 RepID=A0A285D7V2_9BACI|nr:pentapeptide repeat-containing protein [Bacillus oleivorans]SNX75436.1 uncharacterized protein YjbI with pentapeptide repeats [Bacillus oleivorans]
MKNKLIKHIDGLFLPYDDSHAVRELKEELYMNLQERLKDLKEQGYDDETAYSMTINSIGDISELVENVTETIIDSQQHPRARDFSKMDLKNSDFKGVSLPKAEFSKSALGGSEFTGADLSNSSFKSCDLRNVSFDGANLSGAKLSKTDLSKTSFKNSMLDNTDFSYSNLSGVQFDNQTLNGTIFYSAGLKGASFKNAVFRNVSFKYASGCNQVNFDGATMDKATYAVLKSQKAKLTKVTII